LGSKCELNHSIVVQNGITKHVIQNAILGHTADDLTWAHLWTRHFCQGPYLISF
jgi:hypothetical protein